MQVLIPAAIKNSKKNICHLMTGRTLQNLIRYYLQSEINLFLTKSHEWYAK